MVKVRIGIRVKKRGAVKIGLQWVFRLGLGFWLGLGVEARVWAQARAGDRFWVRVKNKKGFQCVSS